MSCISLLIRYKIEGFLHHELGVLNIVYIVVTNMETCCRRLYYRSQSFTPNPYQHLSIIYQSFIQGEHFVNFSSVHDSHDVLRRFQLESGSDNISS